MMSQTDSSCHHSRPVWRNSRQDSKLNEKDGGTASRME